MLYDVVFSGRKTMSIEVTRDCKVVVRAPYFTSKRNIEKFVGSHTEWISNKIELQKKRIQRYDLTEMQIKNLKKSAEGYIFKRVKEYSNAMGLFPEKVKITSAKTRFGSCGANGNICFSCYLMLYPKEAIDYVIVHELAHLKHHNHSKSFYALVERYMPDYKARQKLLKQG